MPRFKLTPIAHPESAMEFDGVDASSALSVASRVRFHEADLSQDGIYVCTIRSHRDDHSGFWIVEKHASATPCEMSPVADPGQALPA